eukprot:ANDGO_02760.mRNA.1 hypothetical protein
MRAVNRKRGFRKQMPASSSHSSVSKKSSLLASLLPSAAVHWVVIGHIVIASLARIAMACMHPIQDCDETYNFWEPLHSVMFGDGFKTWEYASQYALRPWAFVYMHTVPAAVIHTLFASKAAAFFGTRAVLGIVCACAEGWFVQAASPFVNPAVLSFFLVIAPGMQHASIAFLPSSFSMLCMTLCSAAVLNRSFSVVVVTAASAVILGWPFVALAFVPAAVWVLCCAPFRRALFIATRYALLLVTVVLICDRFGYGVWTFSAWNIVEYNVVHAASSTLYGVEPASYYLLNLALNWNAIFLLAILGAACALWAAALAVVRSSDRKLATISSHRTWAVATAIAPFPLWLAFHSSVPHKEERFMVPVYPVLAFSAAFAAHLLVASSPRFMQRFMRMFRVVLLVSIAAVSLSRIAATVHYYSAPLSVYPFISHSGDHWPLNRLQNVCVAGEWHRFPAHFLLSPHQTVQFLRSDFRGELPAFFSDANAHFNDGNLDEPSRYVSPSECDYVVALETERDFARWRSSGQFALESSVPFLENASCLSALRRALYIPGYMCTRTGYQIWKRVM